MNLSEITTKCYILALIIRDDDERLLLGDGFFEFTDKLQHFTPNTFQNDVVELQGTDGQLLAGQVRRTAMQSFDGYIGDATVSQQTTEQNRQRFLAFFRKKHFYKVIYIFPDGTAIKRQRGYIVDAPSIKEMFQRFPEYHVGLNFEDPNYYEYDEDESGQEIFAHAQEISLSNLLVGGLVWDEYGAISHAIAWGDYETQTTSDGFLQITNDIDIRAPLSLTHLYGNATQETLSGKNLLPPSADWNQTLSGVSVKCEGGIYTFSGTATSAGTTNVHSAVAPYTIQAGDYFHYGNSFASSQINIQVFFTDNTSFATSMSSTNRIIALDNFNGNSYVGRTIASYRVNFAGDNTFNGTASPMILHNISTQTDYEPYTGGSPMPNPQFPSDVNVVSGAQTVKIVGKNIIYNHLPTTSTSAGITITSNSDGSIIATGTATGLAAALVQDQNQSIDYPAGTYTLSVSQMPSAHGELRVNAYDPTNTSTSINQYSATVGANSLTFTTERTFRFRTSLIVARSGDTLNNFRIDNLMLEQSATPTAFEPYQWQSYEINLGGTNLLPSTGTTPVGGTGVSITRNNDGTYTVNGTASSGGYIDIGTIDFKQGQTYTISGITGWTATTLQLFTISDTAFPLGHRLASYNGPTTQTALSDETCTVRLYIYQGTTYNNVVVKPQVQLGSKATPYAPYTTYSYELAKIGTYQDYIWNDGGTWYIHKEVGKVVFDGSESWVIASNGNSFYCTTVDAARMPDRDTIAYAVSNYYTAETYNRVTAAPPVIDYGMALSNTANRIVIRNKGITTVADFQTWLGTHNTTVYYALATQTDTEITDSELIEQLNHIYSLYGGQNNLWLIPSGGAQGEMGVRFPTSYSLNGSGYEWEEGAGSAQNIVYVEGIDRTLPVWKVIGPANNPTLTNITTGQTISWQSYVPEGQELIIDMDAQTAMLSGANVFAFIEGEWLELQTGQNRLDYSAEGASEPSTIEWNGVVG